MSSGNVEFARGAVNYFSVGRQPAAPHWSLAVEEQFYFVWPLLFCSCAFLPGRWARMATAGTAARPAYRPLLIADRGRQGRSRSPRRSGSRRVSQPWAFFSMPTRLWEFALGGVVAVVLSDRGGPTGRRAALLQGVGLAAVAIGVVAYDQATPYPGVAALLPALGAVALVVGGQHAGDGAISRWLSAPWLRWLGRMSYAWYLWHWPLVGLAPCSTATSACRAGSSGRPRRSGLRG
jgi:peptidoglycan/LPS O-acetylase OafA/YrhL